MINSIPSKGAILLTGTSHPRLANLIAQHLDLTLGKCDVFTKSNGETAVEIKETVRGRDVYIIQSGTQNVNNDVMELLILVYACKTSSARSITVVMPYLPYCKQNKMRKRGSIVSKLMATMLSRSGMTRLITMDLYSKEIQGFFDKPVDNLRASPFLIKYIEESIPEYRNAVIVARNPGAVHRATSYAERLRLSIAVVHGEERSESEKNDGRNSPPPLPECKPSRKRTNSSNVGRRQRNESFHAGLEMMPMLSAKEKPPLRLVGDVKNRVAIIVDNLIDEMEQFIAAAELLREEGARQVYVMVTHGLLSSEGPSLLVDSVIDEVVVTNTIPHDKQKVACPKIKTVDVSVLLAEAIRRIHFNESMSYLFMNIPKDD